MDKGNRKFLQTGIFLGQSPKLFGFMGRVEHLSQSAGIAMMLFGWWGLHTVSGRRVFDEMAGIIPLLVGGAGVIALSACAFIAAIQARRG